MTCNGLVQRNGKKCSIRRMEYPEFQTGIFGGMKSAHDFSPWNYSALFDDKYLHIFIIFSILVRVSEGSPDTKSVSLPPINFFPNLYGYFKRPDNGIRKTRSEPAQPRKKIVKTFRSKVRFLPPIATLYPEKDHDEISQQQYFKTIY